MINLVWSGLLTLLLLAGCGFDGTPTRHNDFVPLTSIVISAGLPTIAEGTSTALTVTGNYSGLFTRDITDQAVWSSGSTAVANFITAAAPNRVTGIAPGAAVLTATVGGVSATFTVTVSNATVTSIAITPAAPTIAKGLTTQFAASGTFSDNTTQDLTPDAVWASSAPDVATVSNVAGSKGFAQALTGGTSTISAEFRGISATTLLTITAPALQSITVTPARPSILSLSAVNLKATGTYSDGSTADITSQATWVSSQTGVVAIDSSGVATTFGGGSSTITASLAGFNGATLVNVKGGNLTRFTVSPVAPALVKGTVARLSVLGTFDNGSSRDITGVVVWTPADTALATVTKAGGNLAWLNANGVTAVGFPTKITASVTTSFGVITNSLNLTELTVTDPTLLSLAISPTSFTGLAAGTSTRFTATATFNNGLPPQDVTYNASWSSNNGAIASVGDSGLAKGRVSGVAANASAATISAAFGGFTVTAPVTVTAPTTLPTTGITVSGAVAQGNQVSFKATAANGQDVTEDTTWAIDKPNVAILADSLNQPGQVVGVDSSVNSGTAILTATFGGTTATTTIIVP